MKVITVRLKTVLLALLLVVCGALSVLTASVSGAAEVYWNGKTRALPIYCVERSDNKIAISFDCAWGTEYTDKLLEEMAARGVRATFFAVEFWTEKHPDYIQKIDAAGHEIGTHSATHSYMSKQSEEVIRKELASSSEAITAITGKKVELFRPPYGDYNDTLIRACEGAGIYPVQWDVDSLDWKDLSAKEIVERVVSRVKSGSIILCHNNGLHTAEAVPIIIDTLRAKGYEFVPVGELLYRENYTIDDMGKQILKEGA